MDGLNKFHLVEQLLGCTHGTEARRPVECGALFFRKKLADRFGGAEAAQPQFLRQPSCESPETRWL
jgi:hypothetical protein